MNQIVRRLSLLTSTSIIFAFLLGGCVASKNDTSKDAMMEPEEKPLSAPELKDAILQCLA